MSFKLVSRKNKPRAPRTLWWNWVRAPKMCTFPGGRRRKLRISWICRGGRQRPGRGGQSIWRLVLRQNNRKREECLGIGPILLVTINSLGKMQKAWIKRYQMWVITTNPTHSSLQQAIHPSINPPSPKSLPNPQPNNKPPTPNLSPRPSSTPAPYLPAAPISTPKLSVHPVKTTAKRSSSNNNKSRTRPPLRSQIRLRHFGSTWLIFSHVLKRVASYVSS